MKLKTLLAAVNVNPLNRNRFGMIRAVHFTVEELKANRYTHLAVEMDGTIFAWSGKIARWLCVAAINRLMVGLAT